MVDGQCQWGIGELVVEASWRIGVLAFFNFGILAFWYFDVLAFWRFGVYNI